MLDMNFEVSLVRTHSADEAFDVLRSRRVDLLLVNRKLDRDQSDGLAIIQGVKADPELAATPCMLITNFDEHQQKAIAAGAEPGFGKQRLQDPATKDLLARFLE